MVAPFALLLLRQSTWKRTVAFVAGLVVSIGLLCGLYDWLTWGSPFQSLIAFADYTLIERASSSLQKHQPAWWYFGKAHEWMMLPAVAAIAFADRPLLKRCVPFVVLPLLALSLIHHKEVRYLQAIVPFIALLAAAALVGLATNHKVAAPILFALTFAIGLTGVRDFEKRTAPATLAARWLGDRYDCVAASQIWAYGHHLYIRGSINDLPVNPSAAQVAVAAPGCMVGLYESELTTNVSRALSRLHCREIGGMDFRRGRPVVLFDCTAKTQ